MNNELIMKLESLPEKSQEIIRTISVLKRAEAKRQRRRQRNLKLLAKGGMK